MKRLQAIFSLVEKCGTFADIGCDHGKLCLEVYNAKLADKIIAADISQNSLQKAQNLLKGKKNCSFIVSDGLEGFDVLPDTVVVSGLGGREIAKIIDKKKIPVLIIQPQNQIPLLRQAICQNGYKITHDFVVAEGKRFYEIIKAIYTGKNSQLTDLEAEFGVFYKQSSASLLDKLTKLEIKIKSFKPTQENLKRLKNITEVKKWQL